MQTIEDLGVDLVACALAFGLMFPFSWLGILLHELGHAVVAGLVGGRVLDGRVGAGPHVWPLRLFGVPWEFRLLPLHGWVRVLVPPGRCWRMRHALVNLAGPLVTTAIAAGSVRLLLRTGFSSASTVATAWSVTVCAAAFWCCVQAIVCWLPVRPVIAGQRLDSDVLLLWQLRHRLDIAEQSRQHAVLKVEHEALAAFLRGDGERALQLQSSLAEGDFPFPHRMQLALYTWPVVGARASFAELEDIAAAFAVWRRRPDHVPGRHHSATIREMETAMLVNRAFFAALAGDPDLLPSADAYSRAAVDKRPKEAAFTRTRGFVELQQGRVPEAMKWLRRAWSLEEPFWLRSICAAHLAVAHALLGDGGRARRMLAKARRLHPHNYLLRDAEQRVHAALQTAPPRV